MKMATVPSPTGKQCLDVFERSDFTHWEAMFVQIFDKIQGSILTLSGYLGSIVGILLYFLDFCSPQGSILALSGYLGSIVGIFL